MRITSKGQVTIPAHIREKAGLFPHTEVDFIHDDDGVRIVPAADPRQKSRGQLLVDHLRGQSDITMSTDEIMALTRES
jgi:AbrB family looped-hinge helix DNA binding protein